MSEETFTNRHVEPWTIAKIDGAVLTSTDGWSTSGSTASLHGLIRVGDAVECETYGGLFGSVCGWRYRGQWYGRKSDQQIEQERADLIADMKRRDRERLDKMRGEWIGRTENLPGWLQERVQTFRERGGEKFELEGWGYELAVCELAALYAKHPDYDSRTSYNDLPDEIRDYDHAHGCSGNQHGMASALAHAHLDGQSLAGTVSALSPITGDAFYEASGS